MKQKLLAASFIGALVLVATPAAAQGVKVRATTTASTSPIRAEMRAEFEARKASSTERRMDLQLNVVKRKAAQTSKVLTATVERLEKIVTRIESRIAKVKAEGGVTAEAEAAIASAKDHLSKAKVSIATFASVELNATSTLRANFERVKGVAGEAKMHIREAHRSLMSAVRSLKPGQSNVRATSTATTTLQ